MNRIGAIVAWVWRILTSASVRLLFAVIICVLVLEGLSSAVIYVRYDWARDPGNHDFLEMFSFTNAFVKPLIAPRVSPDIPACTEIIDNLAPYPWEAKRVMEPDPVYGARLGQNICFRRKGSLIATNDQGFSLTGGTAKHYTLEPDSDVFRVIVVGGSTVMGLGARTPDQNLPAHLERQIQAEVDAGRGGKRVEVINGGVGGYYSANEFLYLASELVLYNPDLVIVYNGWNDQSRGWRNPVRALHVPRSSNNERVLSLSFSVGGSITVFAANIFEIVRAAANNSTTLFLARRGLAKIRLDGGTAQQAAPPGPQELAEIESRVDISIQRYEKNLRLMAALAEIQGFSIAIFLQPLRGVDDAFEVSGNTVAAFNPERAAFWADARPLFEKLNVESQGNPALCFGDVSRSLAAIEATSVYIGGGHLNGLGNEIVGTAIVTRLAECGMLGDL